MKEQPNDYGLRLLSTLKVLEEQTDAEHGIQAGPLREKVARKVASLTGRAAKVPDPRTTRSDVATLVKAGYSIDTSGGTRCRYSFQPNFEQWELRFLADAVRTSRSLTQNQGKRIIAKLKSLATIETGKILDRRLVVQQLYHSGSFEQTAFALDEIEKAIDNGWKLSYVQTKRSADGSETTRRQSDTGQEVRIVDPIEYVYSPEGYYYLIYLDEKSRSGTKTPRIDRMKDVRALEGTRATRLSGEKKADLLNVFRQSFGMFESKPVDVTLILKAKHVKSIMDRFGENTPIEQVSAVESKASITVGLSKVFYSWIAQFGGEVRIEGPDEAVQGMKSFLEANLNVYKESAQRDNA